MKKKSYNQRFKYLVPFTGIEKQRSEDTWRQPLPRKRRKTKTTKEKKEVIFQEIHLKWKRYLNHTVSLLSDMIICSLVGANSDEVYVMT